MEAITNPNQILGQITKSPLFFSIQALVLAAVIFTFLSKKSSSNLFTTKNRRLPPGPRQWPVIGNTYGMLTNRPVFRWIHRVMKELDTEIACFNFGGVQSISISCDEIAREALKEKDAVFAERPDSFAVGLLSGGYKSAGFTPYGEQCKKMRKVMVSMNSTTTLNRLQDRRTLEADNLLAYVINLSSKSKTVNIREIAQHGCHSVVMRQVFGKRTFGESSPADGGPGPAEIEHIKAIFQSLEYTYANSLSDYYSWMRGWNLDGYDGKIKEASDVMDKYHVPIIEERIEMWRKKEGKKMEADDWLDILVSLKDDDGSWLLSPDEIKAQIKEIMVAAVDNPSNNAEWVLAEMLKHPEILKKALEELDMEVGKDRLVQESDIPNLNYIKACSREGYRMHPIAPFLPPRVAREDTSLAGYFVPKGSQIIISRIALGRNPKIWSKPDEFKPERHLGSEVLLAEPDLRFATFSTGRRGCVGLKMGTSMTIMLLARLLQGFNWSGKVEVEEAFGNLFMAKPLELCAEPRLAQHLYPKTRE